MINASKSVSDVRRVRRRLGTQDFQIQGFFQAGDNPRESFDYTTQWHFTHSEIGDVPKGQSRVKDCYHYKCEVIDAPGSPLFQVDKVADGYRYQVEYRGWVGYAPSGDSLFVPEPSPQWVDSSFRSFAEQVPVQMSLPNFLIELKDVRELAAQVVALKNRYKHARSFGDLKRYLGDRWLTYNFGLRPMVLDILAGLNASEAVRKRIAFLKKTYGRPITARRTYTEIIDEKIQGPSDWEVLGSFGSRGTELVLGRSTRTRYPMRVKHTVGATLLQELPGLDDPYTFLRGLVSAYGIDRPFSVVWEAIPFSWMADYFLRIGDLMDTVQVSQPLKGSISVRDGWLSSQATVHTTCNAELSYRGETQSGVSLAVKQSYYRRAPGITLSSGPVLYPGQPLGLSQFLNIASALH